MRIKLYSFWTLNFIIIVYFSILLCLAHWIVKGKEKRQFLVNNPYIYSLSLAVYCTAWTFYGSVELAVNNGMLFIAVHLGALLSIMLWWIVLRKIIRITKRLHITSVADFISARYDKSMGIGFLVSMFCLIGLLPYVSIQLKSIRDSIKLLSNAPDYTTFSGFLNVSEIFVLIIIIIATIVLGIQKLQPNEKHEGLIFALSIESFIKLISLMTIGIFVTYFLNDGFISIIDRIPEVVGPNYAFMGHRDFSDIAKICTYVILSSAGILLLPRQFHMAAVENYNEKHIKTAKWMFPLYLLLVNIFVIPIAIGGRLEGLDVSLASNYVLLIPKTYNNDFLTLFTFIGGFSAAAGMLTITTVTITIMISNNMIIPILNKFKSLNFLIRHLLKIRWAIAAAFLTVSYIFTLILADKYNLVSTGMISFAAALQMAPAVLGALYWRHASRGGVYLGLILGGFFWFYTLIIPAFSRSGLLSTQILENGLFGIELLKPEAFLGLSLFDSLTHSVLWTMLFNIGGFVIGSKLFPISKSESMIAEEFLHSLPIEENLLGDLGGEETVNSKEKKEKVLKIFRKLFSKKKADELTFLSFKKLGIQNKEKITILKLSELYEELERKLAGVIGTAAAHSTLVQSHLITDNENQEILDLYANVMSNLHIPINEINKKIILYKEKEELMTKQAQLLEEAVKSKSIELEKQKEKTFNASKLSALGEMAGGIAHEINNPLAIIKLKIGILKKHVNRGDYDKEKIIETAFTIEKTTNRIFNIIQGMRNISRDSTNEHHQEVKISEIIEDCLSVCREKFKIQSIDFKLICNEDDLNQRIFCKRIKLSQVFVNLLNNAYDAVILEKNKWIHIEISKDETHFYFYFIDSGPGVAHQTEDKIFQPFFTTKDVGSGVGLGLSLSKSFIEEHDGQIYLDQESDNTCFVVMIPSK